MKLFSNKNTKDNPHAQLIFKILPDRLNKIPLISGQQEYEGFVCLRGVVCGVLIIGIEGFKLILKIKAWSSK